MQGIVLIIALTATFVFGFFVVRAMGRFLDENQASGDQAEDMEK